MNRIPSLLIAAFAVSILASPWSMAVPNLQVSGKASPDVSFDRVEKVFGYNLNTSDPISTNLLLAIGMDHTSANSPSKDLDIGIPFIIDKGPGYWVDRLSRKDYAIDVLVNNALILLFSIEDIPDSEATASKVLAAAADKGYWPADYFIADTAINDELTRNFNAFSVVPYAISADQKKETARQTMKKLNRCAAIGFAPCQFRIGFWLSNSPSSLKDGIGVLREAIKTALKDNRYMGVMNGTVVMAAQLIVVQGGRVGLDDVILEEYAKLAQSYSS